jgi:hypothetical protein
LNTIFFPNTHIFLHIFQLNPIERYAMKFVEDTGANWAAVQLRAVEMEIEQQKREWEEKRQIQRQQEELEKQRTEKEDNEMLTYSREDAMNKVNIRSKNKSQLLGKRKIENANLSPPKANSGLGKKSNGMEVVQNGIASEKEVNKILKTPPKKFIESPATAARRNTRKNANRSLLAEESLLLIRPTPTGTPLVTSRKSDRSTSIHSIKSTARSTSESTSRSTADSMSHQTATTTSPDDSDSECSLDVMIDSNDVNDSDSNSNQQSAAAIKERSHFDSTSQDDDTLLNDDSTMTDETTIEKMSKSFKESTDSGSKIASSPRTRSRGTVNVNLWTLDESPIQLPKRQKTSSNHKNSSDVGHKEEKQLKADFGVKECKVSVVDIQPKALKPPDNTLLKPSPKARAQKRLSSRNNHTLDSWLQKPPEKLQQPEEVQPAGDDDVQEERIPITRQRRNTILNKTL